MIPVYLVVIILSCTFCTDKSLLFIYHAHGIVTDLVGCDAVVRKLEEYRATMEQCKSLGRDPREFIEWNFVFAGSPGTGKTTVARRMGRMFSRLGLLPCEDVVEVSASDLITGYVGQAGKKSKFIRTFLNSACFKTKISYFSFGKSSGSLDQG